MRDTLEKLFKFGLVGGLGTVVNTILLWILASTGLHYLLAAVIATETAIITNFIGNHIFTFSDTSNNIPTFQKFFRFQTVSMFTLGLTIAILWILVTTFGQTHLLIWNLFAIGITFLVNFSLNKKYTWPSATKTASMIPITLAIFLVAAATVHAADVAAVSQMGYHPDSAKQVIVYTDDQSGSFSIKEGPRKIATFDLQKPENFEGQEVRCQGGMPCLVGDFTNFSLEGHYTIETSNKVTTPSFDIRKTLYERNIEVLFEFFDAMQQQGSSYHADMHANNNPDFNNMADGSFIMHADQAAMTLIRLGNAYRRNPGIFDADSREYIKGYADYLAGLQGLEIQEHSDGTGFRLDEGMSIERAFVPGPTNMTSLDVYGPGSSPTLIQTVPVQSLCGADDGSGAWDTCMDRARSIYKCQDDEPCLDLSYAESTGTVRSTDNGYGVAQGWGYEFGCYFDVDIQDGNFNDAYNPCMIFYPQESREHTTMALLGFLEAIPAVSDISQSNARELFVRATNTHDYIKQNYGDFRSGDEDAGYFGAALFLLYDYSGDPAYLEEAYAIRDNIRTTLISDVTRGNEFYWEEYIRHRQALESHGLKYHIGNIDPAEFFRGKIFHDYKDRGSLSISANGERVYEFDRNIQFQNSRYMLLEGLFAAKTLELHETPEAFIKTVADNQIAWLTGQNLVQDGVSLASPTRSYSFIFGIGNHPEQFHSRYLVDTGYSTDTGGKVIGARGTGLQFFNGTDYVFLDGRHTILGQELGSIGNSYREEEKTVLFQEKTFSNGRRYIPGWINGAFDINTNPQETDIIFNYRDNHETYEFTESTNEIVAAAIEFFAYRDALLNGKPRHPGVTFSTTTGSIMVTTTPAQADVHLDGALKGTSDASGQLQISPVATGQHTIKAEKPGYLPVEEEIFVQAGETAETALILPQSTGNGILLVHSVPSIVTISLNGTVLAETGSAGNLTAEVPSGSYLLQANKSGYLGFSSSIRIEENTTTPIDINLKAAGNGSVIVITTPGLADVGIDGRFVGTTSMDGNLSIPGIAAGEHDIIIGKEGYIPYSEAITVETGKEVVVKTVLIEGNGTNGTITMSGTNLTGERIFETQTLRFWVELDRPDTITWTVNNETVQTSKGSNDTLIWSPGNLYTSNTLPTEVTAHTSSDMSSWDFDVDFVVNPFFSAPDGSSDVLGSSQTKAHVFTNDDAATFTSMNITIENTHRAGSTRVFALEPSPNFERGEVDWHVTFTAEPGDNYLTRATGYDNITGETTTYLFGTARSHHRFIPGGRDDDDDSRRSGGGGGGGTAGEPPTLVYALFGKDVIPTNGTQNITLDANVGIGGEITRVEADIVSPIGSTFTIDMDLRGGTAQYGTWYGEFDNLDPGSYRLDQVRLWDRDIEPPVSVDVDDISFYAVSDEVSASERLELVYSVLNESQVKNGSDVLFTLDARDSTGVDFVSATVVPSRSDPYRIDMSRIEGTAQYGTWEGKIHADLPDTTYIITNVTLMNTEEERTISLRARSFYVEPLPRDQQNLLTGAALGPPIFSKEWMLGKLDDPLVPTLIGFGLMLVVMLVTLVGHKVKSYSSE